MITKTVFLTSVHLRFKIAILYSKPLLWPSTLFSTNEITSCDWLKEEKIIKISTYHRTFVHWCFGRNLDDLVFIEMDNSEIFYQPKSLQNAGIDFWIIINVTLPIFSILFRSTNSTLQLGTLSTQWGRSTLYVYRRWLPWISMGRFSLWFWNDIFMWI